MGDVTSIGRIKDRLPKVGRQRPVKTLKDLYDSFGKGTAYKRYNCCWDIFPVAFAIKDLDEAAKEIRKHLKAGLAPVFILEKPPDYYSRFENLGKDKLLNMLKCIHSLRRDLLELSNETET